MNERNKELYRIIAEKYPDIFYFDESIGVETLNLWAYCDKCLFWEESCWGSVKCLKQAFPPDELRTGEKHKCAHYSQTFHDALMEILNNDEELKKAFKDNAGIFEKKYQYEMDTETKFNEKNIIVTSESRDEAIDKILAFVKLNTRAYDDLDAYKEKRIAAHKRFIEEIDSPEMPVNPLFNERWEKTKNAKDLREIIDIWLNEFEMGDLLETRGNEIYLP